MEEIKYYDFRGVKVVDAFKIMYKSFSLLSSFLLFILLATALCEIIVGNKIGLYISQLINDIVSSDNEKGKRFFKDILKNSGWMVLICLILVFKKWIGERLSIILKSNLVKKIHEKYFEDNSFYELLIYDSEIDNPDARITNDCSSWTSIFSEITTNIVQMPIYVVWYGIQTEKQFNMYAIYFCVGFSLLGIILSRIALSPIVKLTKKLEAANGDYRLANVLIKKNAESIALSKAQKCEENLITKRLESALDIQTSLANHSLLLNIFSNGYYNFSNGLVYICIYFCTPKGLTPAEIAKFIARVAFIVGQFLSGLTMFTTIMQDFSKLCGHSTRIEELISTLGLHKEMIKESIVDNKVKMENVDIIKPNSELLIPNLTFEINPTDSVFIEGQSGCGKSSIFRALSKIWPIGQGQITIPHYNYKNLLVLTQSPYIPMGNLFECCAFPLSLSECYHDDIIQAINFFELDYLLQRNTNNWQLSLSPGERQRIALCRILIHKPTFLLIDEGTSAIPQKLETKLYEWMKTSGISYISIAHQSNIRKYHKYILKINDDKTYSYKLNTEWESHINL